MTETRPSPQSEQRAPVNTSGEIRRLHGCINDLISLQALPAIWIGQEASRIIAILLEAMLGILELDFAYARANDTPEGSIDVLRFRDRRTSDEDASAVRQALDSWLTSDESKRLVSVQTPIRIGRHSGAQLRLGAQVETGVLVIGSEHPGFPTAIDTLLLRVAANQLTVALHECRTAAMQRRTAEDLERRVAARTLELLQSNEQLRRQEVDLRALHEELAAELQAMTRLHALSTGIWEDRELQPLLAEVLDASIRLLNADFGNVQLYDPEARALRIVAQRGFEQEFIDYFDHVDEGTASCGRALELLERVVVEDVLVDSSFAPHMKIVDSAGYRAVQSTPLISRSGEPLGVLSTHFRKPHRPSEPDLRLLDLYARHAAEIIERRRADDSLRRLQEDLAHFARISTMGELTASIAHEVNQPLAAVSTNADACLRWLKRKEPNLEEASDALERIVRESGRASDVISRIRALSSKTTPQQTRLQLNDIVHEVVTLAQSKLLSQQITLTIDASATLPEVLGDRIQLQQVLLNLILNAIDATQPVVGRLKELQIRTSSASSEEVVLAVRDSGVGLDSTTQRRLFEPFFTTKPEGMGLGLSISRRIVEAHGGQLHATPNPDYGTTMAVVLPSAARDRAS